MSIILITGGTGCIGAATVQQLVRHPLGAELERIVIVSRSGNTKLLHLWQGPELDPRLVMHQADVADAEGLQRLVRETHPTHIIHLGAWQSPACDANPTRGLQINVGGTLQLLRQVQESTATLERFVLASSAAVYGRRSFYPEATIPEFVPLAPPNLYGVWKLACEHLTRLFHEQTQVPTVCLRLNTTYGLGRNLGRTAAPTTAIKHVAAGAAEARVVPFRMPYAGRENYHYVEDVAVHFARCALDPFEGYGAFNIKGQTMAIKKYLANVARVAGQLGLADYCDLGIEPDAEENLFVCDLEDDLIDHSFPGMPRTPIEMGIRKSLERFMTLAQLGQLPLR